MEEIIEHIARSIHADDLTRFPDNVEWDAPHADVNRAHYRANATAVAATLGIDERHWVQHDGVVQAQQAWRDLTPAQRRALAGGHAMPSVFGRLVHKGLWDDDDCAPTHWGRFILAVQNETARLDDEWGIGEDGSLYHRVGAA